MAVFCDVFGSGQKTYTYSSPEREKQKNKYKIILPGARPVVTDTPFIYTLTKQTQMQNQETICSELTNMINNYSPHLECYLKVGEDLFDCQCLIHITSCFSEMSMSM